MPKKETFHIHPSGHETSQEEECFRLSTLDLIITQNYSVHALIFKLDVTDSDKPGIISIFKRGLELTLGQCRHVVGTIERNQYGDFSIVKKRDSTVEFVVQMLDGPEDNFPSYSDIEKAKFSSESLGDLGLLSIEGMTMGSKCSPDSSPVISGFQLNFIPGGLIFTAHNHHLASDIEGSTSLIQQIADNCYSIVKGTPPPTWDESFMDRSRFIQQEVAKEDQVDPPPSAPRHPDWLPCSWLLFHIPKSKSAELKRLATPEDGTWISTYDALAAFLWRVMSRNRAQIYKPDLKSHAIFMQAINMRSRLTPKISPRYQGNVLNGGLSQLQANPLTLAEVISEAPLPRVASFLRQITTSVTQKTLEQTLAMVAPIRDKSTLYVRLDSFPPMSFAITDWRDAKMCDADWGFGRPVAFRQLSDIVRENQTIVYPASSVSGDPDEGLEVVVPFERHAVDMLIEDPDMKKFFEFRGFEAGAP